jgi:hypothetical protein
MCRNKLECYLSSKSVAQVDLKTFSILDAHKLQKYTFDIKEGCKKNAKLLIKGEKNNKKIRLYLNSGYIIHISNYK